MRRNVTVPILLLFAGACLLVACGDDDNPVVPPEPEDHWQEIEVEIGCWEYQDNRFFRLDLPPLPGDAHEMAGYTAPDDPGRGPFEYIDLSSIRIYRNVGTATPRTGDVTYAAATLDSTGVWDRDGYIDSISDDDQHWVVGWTWRPLEFTLLLDSAGGLVAADLGREMLDTEVLALVYTVVDGDGNVLYTVGDHPDLGGERGLDITGQDYYRFKLLKPEQHDPFTFQYVLRNIYDLHAWNINIDGFELRIEALDPDIDLPTLHGTRGLDYLRLFGLDSENEQGEPTPDGLVDWHRSELFDLEHGLLRFPLDFPFPFAADEDTYRQYAQPDQGQWEWDDTYLAESITTGAYLYDWETRPADYELYGRFRLVTTYLVWVHDQPTPPDRVSLDRPDWYPASLPLDQGLDRDGRADDTRWFAPRERVVRRLLEPDVTGPARDETVTTLELAIEPGGGAWSWAGVMTGFPYPGLDPSQVDRLEIWINDFAADQADRAGVLHVDLGHIDEDFAWRLVDGTLETDTLQHEDLNFDGVFATLFEDVGLDAVIDPHTHEIIVEGDAYSTEYHSQADPYPAINNTARNNHEDSEDLDHDDRFDRENQYLTWSLDLAAADTEIDVVRDHPDADLQGTAWRKYVLPLDEGAQVWKSGADFLEQCSHLRIWIDNPDGQAPDRVQVARLRFR